MGKNKIQTKYAADLDALNTKLKDGGIVLGDSVKLTPLTNKPCCGYYVGTEDSNNVTEWDNDIKQYKFGENGLLIVISPFSLELYEQLVKATEEALYHNTLAPYPTKVSALSVLVRDIKSLEKLVVSENK
ncbi:MAG: hypothetical protein NTY99_02755 [DPANN group archaeon]|nr:hypothetical protein [DPANN group archaeon]